MYVLVHIHMPAFISNRNRVNMLVRVRISLHEYVYVYNPIYTVNVLDTAWLKC